MVNWIYFRPIITSATIFLLRDWDLHLGLYFLKTVSSQLFIDVWIIIPPECFNNICYGHIFFIIDCTKNAGVNDILFSCSADNKLTTILVRARVAISIVCMILTLFLLYYRSKCYRLEHDDVFIVLFAYCFIVRGLLYEIELEAIVWVIMLNFVTTYSHFSRLPSMYVYYFAFRLDIEEG